MAADPEVATILEIGSATGDGSTRAFVEGALRRPEPPALYCLEVDGRRYQELVRRYADTPFVHAFHASSVGAEAYASEREVREFCAAVRSALDAFPLEQVLGWRSAELGRLRQAGPGLAHDGIALVRRERGVERFGAVLLDGSEFTARAELDLVHGARYLLLDDTSSFKNHANCLRLLGDPHYELIAANPRLRNGYAVFRAR